MSGAQHSQVHASGGSRHGTQPGGGTRQVHPQRGDDQDQGTLQDPIDAESAAREVEAIAANQALRIANESTLLVKNIQVEEIFPQILSEVVLAGSTGNEILLDMLKQAAGGIIPVLPMTTS